MQSHCIGGSKRQRESHTILGKIMACFIMAGEIMGGEKYGGISPKPPIFPGRNFTCDFCFAKFSLHFKII